MQAPGGSNIGVKGEEKLGGGLSAWFQCESSADFRGGSGTGQNGFCSRNSAIGFKGGFGNVYIGKWDTPFKQAFVGDGVGSEDTGLEGTAFLLAGSSTGTKNNTYSAAGAGYGRDIWKRRQEQTVNYVSPSFSGFTLRAAYSSGNAATSAVNSTPASKPRVTSVSGIYKNGPINLGVGYEEHSEFGVDSGGQGLNDNAWVVSGAYTFSNKIKIGGAYNEQSYDNTTAGAKDMKKKAYTAGVEWDLAGPHSVGGSYTHATTSGGAMVVNAVTAQNLGFGGNGSNLYQVFYGHAFSKRTSAKLFYVNLTNNQNSGQVLGGVNASGTNQDQSAFGMLVKHNF